MLVDVARVLESTHFQIELVAILGPENKSFHVIVICSWDGTRLTKAGEEAVVLSQKQRAVVVHVVAMKPVRDGSLRRDRLDGRMSVDAGHRGVEARIRNAPDADAPVVIRHIFD